MKTITPLFIVAILSAPAHADLELDNLLFDLGKSLGEDTMSLEPAHCTKLLAKARERGVPASQKVKLYSDTKVLREGEYAMPEIRKACDALEYANKVAFAKYVVSNAGFVTGAAGCAKGWPDILAAGVKPTEPIDMEVSDDGLGSRKKTIRVSGTLEEVVKKYCIVPTTDREAAKQVKLAPYRKVLKGDKLRLLLDAGSPDVFTLAGGVDPTPARMASARAWFTGRVAGDCTDGRTMMLVEKREFDSAHNLTKQSAKQYCGEAVYK